MVKRKIGRKELKKPDEFITISGKIVNWCRDNLRVVTGVGVGVALVFIIAGGVLLFRANREAKARDLYQEALTFLPTQSSESNGEADYTRATAKLEEVQQHYSSTTVATNALVDLGNIYFQQQKYSKAVSCYSDFLQRADLTHPLHAQVLESLGETHEAQGSLQAALEVYRRLAEEGAPVYQAQAQLYLGRVYEAIGDKDKAMIHYDNYLNENPAPLFGEWIRTKLRRWRQTEKPSERG